MGQTKSLKKSDKLLLGYIGGTGIMMIIGLLGLVYVMFIITSYPHDKNLGDDACEDIGMTYEYRHAAPYCVTSNNVLLPITLDCEQSSITGKVKCDLTFITTSETQP